MPWNGRVSLPANLSLAAPTSTRACLLNVVSWRPSQAKINYYTTHNMPYYAVSNAWDANYYDRWPRAERLLVCLSRGFAMHTRLNGSRSCLSGDSWEPKKYCIRRESRLSRRIRCSLRQITLAICYSHRGVYVTCWILESVYVELWLLAVNKRNSLPNNLD